jgi:hypothetical protein
MVKVYQQDRTHPLFPLLDRYIHTEADIDHATARKRPDKRSPLPRSILTELARGIFAHCVQKWNDLPKEAKEWYGENAPPEFCTGFLWWTWSCLIKNYGAGPWTVNASAVGGHCYIRPEGAPEGIWAHGYIDATEIGSMAHIDWEPGCPDETLPLLLVHGWYSEAFDPADTWKTMVMELTGKDPTQSGNYFYVYDPEHPDDPNYALRCIEGEGRTVYISNYTHNPGGGTPGDIRSYAKSLAREIEVLKGHRGAPAVDITSHSMGALVARAYIENQDLTGNPSPAPYQHDVRAHIMEAPPNQGAHFDTLYPGCWNWTSVQQMKHGSEFLTQLNSATTGKSQNVEYSIIASNLYDCEQWRMKPVGPDIPWAILVEGEYVVPEFVTYPDHAHRLCELTDGKPNDGEILTEDTVLSEQDGQPDVAPDHYYVYDLDHWAMRGFPLTPCEAATLVKVILANYDLAKWRAKGKDIEPPEMNWVQHAFYNLKTSKTAYTIHTYMVDRDVDIVVEDLPPGERAYFSDSRNAIILDPELEGESDRVVGQYIAHEGEHSRWYPVNSIYQEYHACKAEADFWNEVKGGETDDDCDWIASFIAQGKHAAMDYIRTLPDYAHLPTYAFIHDDLEDACTVLDDSAWGHPLFLDVQRKGVEMTFQGNPDGIFAYYWQGDRKGAIHPDWHGEPDPVLAAVLAYLSTRGVWNIEDSIHQEYTSFKNMAGVWRWAKNSLQHEFCDLVSAIISTGEEAAKEWIRSRPEYAGLPEYYP